MQRQSSSDRGLITINENVDENVFMGMFDTAKEAYLKRHGGKSAEWCQILAEAQT